MSVPTPPATTRRHGSTEQADGEGQEAGSEPVWRVLIADDQPEHLEMIARAIERSAQGRRIDLIRAKDGIRALHEAKGGVDVAFLDIRMPGSSGLEVAAKMRQDPSLADVPVVIVSSSADPRDVAHADELGVVAYVEKRRFRPFRADIQAVLDQVLNGKPL